MAAKKGGKEGKMIRMEPLNVERCLREASQRLERAKRVQKQMQDQQKVSQEILTLEFSV
jgi:hypothetical protein